jgi:hypothetical protein
MAAALALCALAAAGCGLGPGDETGEVELTVTRDYGREQLLTGAQEATESDTVMRLLDREAEIETRYGGGFVQSIDGLSGGSEDGRRYDWFFYVNGIESPVGSAEYEPTGGDRIWWDYRDWSSAMRAPAVIGSFPQPFLGGFEGDRWETEVVCLIDARTCELVGDRLSESGVEVRMVNGLAAADDDAIRVLVGTWSRLRTDPAAGLLAAGPERSGVFARFTGSGLELIDRRGQIVETARGAGLIAAVRPGDGPPTWLVTGIDPGTVATGAAPLFAEKHLRDRYALAVTSHGLVGLPYAKEGE